MSLKNKWMNKAAGIVPVTIIAVMLMTACGGTTASNTVVPATSVPTAMMAGETPTAMMAGETPTAMMVGETPTAMMVGGTPEAMMTPGGGMMQAVTITMNAQNGSGEDGTATINEKGVVTLDLKNGTTEPQPTHIHKGTCAKLDPTPAFPLTNVVNGKSETTVPSTFTMEAGQAYAINVHKSAAEASTYVSCGDITSSNMTGTPGAMMTPGMMGETMNVTLNAMNTSGQTGTAVITKKSDADVMVSVNLSNGTTEPQPAHIHKGTCANLDPKPAFPLTNVVNGKSDTEVMVTMSDLEKGPYAINIHKSAADASTYVACGDITAAMMGTPGAMMETPGAMMTTPGAMMGTTPIATP